MTNFDHFFSIRSSPPLLRWQSIAKSNEVIQQQLAKLEALKKSLMQEYFG